MPVCRKCGKAYEPGDALCPFCDPVEVRKSPQQAAQSPDDSWISVCRLSGQVDSHAVKVALDANNIPSMVAWSSFGGSGSGSEGRRETAASATEENVLMVPREFQELAVSILKTVMGNDFHAAEGR